MPEIGYVMDERMDQQLTKLQDFFGVDTNAEVLRKAIAFARIAATAADGVRPEAITFTIDNGPKPQVTQRLVMK